MPGARRRVGRRKREKGRKKVAKEYALYDIFNINLKIMQNNATYCLWMATYIIKEVWGNNYNLRFCYLYAEGFIYICNVLFLKLSWEYMVLNIIFDIFICLRIFIILNIWIQTSIASPTGHEIWESRFSCMINFVKQLKCKTDQVKSPNEWQLARYGRVLFRILCLVS